MPINYKEYHPKWKLISKLIRYKRAKNKCEWCGVMNGTTIQRQPAGQWRYICATQWAMIRNYILNGFTRVQANKKLGFTKVVLTVAHIDQDKNNNRFGNLAALCQKCHLSHDHKHHVANRLYGRKHKGEGQLRIGI